MEQLCSTFKRSLFFCNKVDQPDHEGIHAICRVLIMLTEVAICITMYYKRG